jgi:hypothetical protein
VGIERERSERLREGRTKFEVCRKEKKKRIKCFCLVVRESVTFLLEGGKGTLKTKTKQKRDLDPKGKRSLIH